ncbi:MAG TPA: PEGA domain-containing protein [Candidatus Saccharibacteria bacterium]|nr:PEGA domain-containing protein [Candidatus Saccharibacteria bacterium]
MQQYENANVKRRRTLIASYIAMTLAVVAISTICILLVLGYRFDFASNQVERGALLQFSSYPSGATITLNSEKLSFTTPGKQDVRAAAHTVSFSKTGYRAWSKQLTTRAGEVRWLNYARLVPTTVQTDTVKEFASLADEQISPDRNWLLVLPDAEKPIFTLVDLRDPKAVKYSELTIPIDAITNVEGSAHRFKIVEWNLGSKYVLIQHSYGEGQREYIRLDRSDTTDVVNLSTKLGVTLSDIHFSSATVFYGVENGNLRRFDLGNGSLSEPLATSVTSMRLYGEKTIALVSHKDSQYTVGAFIDDRLHTVATYDDTVGVLAEVTRYFSDYYIAIARGASFELVKNPNKTAGHGLEKVVTLTYPGDIKWLDISSSGRHVIAGQGTQFLTYDLELEERTDTNLPNLNAETVNIGQPPQWLDGFVLVSTADNKLRMVDFDGDNQQIVTDALAGFQVSLSNDNKLLYSFSKMQSGTIRLQASKMTID